MYIYRSEQRHLSSANPSQQISSSHTFPTAGSQQNFVDFLRQNGHPAPHLAEDFWKFAGAKKYHDDDENDNVDDTVDDSDEQQQQEEEEDWDKKN